MPTIEHCEFSPVVAPQSAFFKTSPGGAVTVSRLTLEHYEALNRELNCIHFVLVPQGWFLALRELARPTRI